MENTQKHFALQLGALITLYVSLVALIVLVFSIINLLLPDAIEGIWQKESAMSSIRFSIATLVVFFPTYVYLVRVVNTLRRKNTEEYISVIKWLLYITLLVGALILLGNIVTTIYTFLNGELTLRFLLKAGALFVIIGGAFFYYYFDVKEYWRTHEKQSNYFGAGTGVVFLLCMGVGVSLIQGPSTVREMRLDDRQIQDLTNIQWRIEETLRVQGALLDSLDEYYENIPTPSAPEDRETYSYTQTEEGFELCATFAHPTQSEFIATRPYFEDVGLHIANPHNWEHPAGRYCFKRIVKTGDSTSISPQNQEKLPPPLNR